jgi:hypothetical protein
MSELSERIKATLTDDPKTNLPALAIVMVEQAMNFRRHDGTIGTASEIKAFLTKLINGMTDICADATGFPRRRAGTIEVKINEKDGEIGHGNAPLDPERDDALAFYIAGPDPQWKTTQEIERHHKRGDKMQGESHIAIAAVPHDAPPLVKQSIPHLLHAATKIEQDAHCLDCERGQRALACVLAACSFLIAIADDEKRKEILDHVLDFAATHVERARAELCEISEKAGTRGLISDSTKH